jgi:hypothetical protein
MSFVGTNNNRTFKRLTWVRTSRHALCPERLAERADGRGVELASRPEGHRLVVGRAVETALRLRVPVERDHGFRWKMITQSGGT